MISYKIVISKYFDFFQISSILILFILYLHKLNYSYSQEDVINVAITFLFFEILLKTIAFGFFKKKNAFFENSWNVFDFTILLLTIFFSIIQKKPVTSIINFTFYRIFHIIRIIKIKEYTYLMAGLFSSFKAMMNFLLIISIFIFFFSVSSTFLFAGTLENKCFSAELGVNSGKFCSKEKLSCEIDQICGRIPFSNPDNGLTNFDNFFSSCIEIVRIVTFESFTSIIVLMLETFSNSVWFYFIIVGVVGNFFYINLIFAVLKVKYTEYKEKFLSNQNIPEFNQDLQVKTYNLKEAQKSGLLTRQKLMKTRRLLLRYFLNYRSRVLFIQKAKILISLALASPNKSFTESPMSVLTPSDYHYRNKLSITPLSSTIRKNNDSCYTPNRIENVSDFIKKSRLSIRKNRAFDTPITPNSATPFRKSMVRAKSRRHLTEINRSSRMNNFHQIFVNRIAKRESRVVHTKKYDDEYSSSHFGSSKSNANMNDDKNPLTFLILKLVKFFKERLIICEKRMNATQQRPKKKLNHINISFLSKQIKTNLFYESDSQDDVLPFRYFILLES